MKNFQLLVMTTVLLGVLFFTVEMFNDLATVQPNIEKILTK